ncbi:MAG: hypothetical protein HC860_18950 [Alkalinema sp. RU_4_3]|nr:hypothetical protein [Alkalinema sp. RU_4_3]
MRSNEPTTEAESLGESPDIGQWMEQNLPSAESAEGRAVIRLAQSSPPPLTDSAAEWAAWERECGLITYGGVGRDIDALALKERLRKHGFQV